MKNYNMIIDDQIDDEKLQYDINREAEKILALSPSKINKYEYLTGEEILQSNQKQTIEQDRFTYSSLEKAFEKQTKTIQDQGKKQVIVLKTFKPKELGAITDKSDDNEKNLKDKEVFNELSNERIAETYNISKEINFNILTNHFKGSNTAPINFIECRGPMHIYSEIKNGNISIKKIKEGQKQLKSKRNEKTIGNPKHKSKSQLDKIKILKIFITQETKLSNYLMITLKFNS